MSKKKKVKTYSKRAPLRPTARRPPIPPGFPMQSRLSRRKIEKEKAYKKDIEELEAESRRLD
jgi:hypothetical protein